MVIKESELKSLIKEVVINVLNNIFESEMSTKHSKKAANVMAKMGWKPIIDLYDYKPPYICGKSGGEKK
jgi:hypothetical protein